MKYCPDCGNKLIASNIDGANRFVCKKNGCDFIHWNNPVPVVAALVKYNDKYVIARNSKWPNGIFSLITGYLEYGEQPEKSVLREVGEELGLKGEIINYLGHHMFAEKNQLILAFEVIATGNIHTNHELAELKHLSPIELSNYDFGPLYITERVIQEWSRLHANSECI